MANRMNRTATEARLVAWACGEIQQSRGRAAIVMREQAVLEPVSVPLETAGPLSPVCRVRVPVLLASRRETECSHYFNDVEIGRICGKTVVA
jgi:hypothetical protein